MVDFSLLMSIYKGENPAFFDQAMRSLWDVQTLKPSEVVLVEDGDLDNGLYEVLDFWESRLGSKFIRVRLSKNQGLGVALNAGLEHCNFEYVARMDTDDICAEDRFEKQMKFLFDNSGVDVLGGQIEEFEDEVGDLNRLRVLPTSHEDVVKFAKLRCPFNHPSVVYKRDVIRASGGYRSVHLYEDYDLWVRLIQKGVVVANLPDVILYMRSGKNMFSRRGGADYVVSEFNAQLSFYRIGFLSIFQLVNNLAFRIPVRLLPNFVRGFLYEKMLRNK